MLDRLGAAHTLKDVTALQSNRLETRAGECRGNYAIRINEHPMAPLAIHPGEHLADELRAP
jgi:plasmid maintenance system killer protein